MNLSLEQAGGTFLSRVFGWVAKAWETTAEADLIAALDDETIRRIARDCNIQPDQLLELAKAGPDAADEMPYMMRELGIDPMEVETRFKALFRDMQITCAQCSNKAECRHDLAEGTAVEAFSGYCHNAGELNALRATPTVLAE
ncbi:DUF6455 family protein [Ciceribacter sp. L1K22]|uniref:DUF6455 family protein n=1 Tax=Ciceribacter sp. L1K22 TaxID=2820275 RepID=UPI001ABE85B0|nr:DUF6455 family protein [Ciceribacter sp. L1K22]MBO3759804.1 hypothetical protein [Ciceribacter sp. L1K22]